MLRYHPLPKLSFSLPEPVQERIDRMKRDATRESHKLVVCIFGYNSYVRQVLESLRDNDDLDINLVTRSVIERERAQLDGTQAIFELEDIISDVDFWIVATPSDEVPDFRNEQEANLDFLTHCGPVFAQSELLMLKDDCFVVNVCNFARSLDLAELLE